MVASSPKVRFGVVGLDHAHVFGQIAGLLKQGCEFVEMATDDWESSVAREVVRNYPGVKTGNANEVIERDDIDVVVTAAVPDRRAPIAVQALTHNKDVVADKPGCVTLHQLDAIRAAVEQSGRFWSVTFSERFEVGAVLRAGELVSEGRIGNVVQTLGLGPHRIGTHPSGLDPRPDWFYDPTRYGGILTDIASHQVDQFLWFTGADNGEVVASTVGNWKYPDTPGLQDFGEILLRSEWAQGYIRCDWYTPEGLSTWGDGRLFILGTEGYLELRKYVDIAGRNDGNHLFCVDNDGTHYIDCSGVELTYFRDLVYDVHERTETATAQEHTFEATRLALLAQEQASVRGAAVNRADGDSAGGMS